MGGDKDHGFWILILRYLLVCHVTWATLWFPPWALVSHPEEWVLVGLSDPALVNLWNMSLGKPSVQSSTQLRTDTSCQGWRWSSQGIQFRCQASLPIQQHLPSLAIALCSWKPPHRLLQDALFYTQRASSCTPTVSFASCTKETHRMTSVSELCWALDPGIICVLGKSSWMHPRHCPPPPAFHIHISPSSGTPQWLQQWSMKT